MIRRGRVLPVVLVAVFAIVALPRLSAKTIGVMAAKSMIDCNGVDPLAGIWRTGGDGATIAFLPQDGSARRFDIVVLDSNDMSVIPGQIIGDAFATGTIGTYDATFKGSMLKRKVRMILTIDKSLRLTFKPYKQHLSLSLWRLLPYMFRNPVKRTDTRPTDIDAAVRLYPAAPQEGPLML